MSESNNLEGKSFDERLEYYKGQEVIDITEGLSFLIKDSREFYRFIEEMLEHQSRFPILGFKDGSILMIGGMAERDQHISILQATGKKAEDVVFSTSIEGFIKEPALGNPYLDLLDTKYGPAKVSIGRGSTLAVPGIGMEGKERLEKIFANMSGVSVHVPLRK